MGPDTTTAYAAAGDEEIVLSRGDLRLKTSPFGASLRGLWRERAGGPIEEIVTGYTGAKGKVGGQGDVLIPFPGRVGGGRYAFGGATHEMARNDKDGPNAIHGFLRLVPWRVEERTETSVAFSAALDADDHAGYPFALRARVAYALEDDGMTCRFAVENAGGGPAPVAAGFHPYFAVGAGLIDAATLHVPMDATLEFGAGLIPTGRVLPVEGTPYDFRAPRPIGETRFNTCYLHPRRDADGLLRIRLSAPPGVAGGGGPSVTVWIDRAFDYVVLYSGDPLPETHRRRSLAVEPMTCGSDAFNHPEWGLAVLGPGETLSGAWGASASG